MDPRDKPEDDVVKVNGMNSKGEIVVHTGDFHTSGAAGG